MKNVAKRARHTATLQEHARPRVAYNITQEAVDGRRAIAHDLNPYLNLDNKLVTEGCLPLHILHGSAATILRHNIRKLGGLS